MQVETSIDGLLLASDLMWISRITGTAKELGYHVRSVGNVDTLLGLARTTSVRLIILDLDLAKGRERDIIIAFARAHPPRFVAYGSHVDVAALQAARAAGCDPVLPRSKMAEDAGKRLAEWLGP